MDFKNVPKKYRPVPFWSWNEKLETEETRRQVNVMDKAGMGGFFMHARGGLQTEYMSGEWFENVSAAADEAKKCGMYAWAYDENGWPSGFGDGRVNGKGLKYQQKYLRMDDKPDGENTIAIVDGKRFYYEVNPFYVDLMDGDVTDAFIEEIYEPYYEKFKNEITGFFTDEPQLSRAGLPWSFILPEEYKKAYGEELYPHLYELFERRDRYRETRLKFWKLVTDLFSKNFFKKIYDWCEEQGLAFTGHLLCEENFLSQMFTNGAAMPHYEYFTIPGMDCLGRAVNMELTPYQLGSAAMQTGKMQVLSETFALCGHNVSFEELKGIYEHQMAHGVSLLCQHLEGYSIRGIRKRDYPPALFAQQPWWDRYNIFCDTMARTGMILSEGRCDYDVLLLHPMTTVWSYTGDGDNSDMEKYYDEYISLVRTLDKKHIPFHLGDETLIERHGRVDGDKFIVGEMAYKTILIPPCPDMMLLDSTKKLLDEFKKNGGRVIGAEDIPYNGELTDSTDMLYTKRVYDGFDVYYVINPTDKEYTVNIKKGGKLIDAKTGEILPFGGKHTFMPYDSILVLDDKTAQCAEDENLLKPLDLSGEWRIENSTQNIVTLDKCSYWFDGKLEEENGYVLNIQGRACALKRPVNIKQEYTFTAEYVPEELYFVCETPWIFDITVNGKTLEKQTEYKYFKDKSFKMLDISAYVTEGENKITLETEFKQSAEIYKQLEDGLLFEAIKNKLAYDMEIEACYLVGNFGVKTNGTFEKIGNASRYTGGFALTKMPEKVTLKNIEQQGFPFFSGDMTLVKEFDIADTDYEIRFDKKGVNAIDVSVNGEDAGSMLFYPFSADISDKLIKGKNTVRIRFFNNLHNMLGPHHLEMGETYSASPASFFKEKCIWLPQGANTWGGGKWNDNYCFAEVSLTR